MVMRRGWLTAKIVLVDVDSGRCSILDRLLQFVPVLFLLLFWCVCCVKHTFLLGVKYLGIG